MSREAPTTRRYFDKLGRPIRTEVEAFEGDNPRRVDAFYDARGRLACESAPYHSDETPHYTTYEYDLRDRVTAVTRPDGGSTAIVYKAVSAIHRVKATATETVKEADGTVADTRASERLHNILGELVEATDGAEQTLSANKVTTTYVYDTSGLLETVTADGVETRFEYDAAGNRDERGEPGHGDGGRRQEREVRLHGSGSGARADGRTGDDDIRVRPAGPADQPRGPGRDGNGHGDVELRPGERQGAAGEPQLRRHGVLRDVRVQPGRAAGGGRDHDQRDHRPVRRELRLRPSGPSVDDDLSVGAEGGARLQRAGLSRDAHGRDDGGRRRRW